MTGIGSPNFCEIDSFFGKHPVLSPCLTLMFAPWSFVFRPTNSVTQDAITASETKRRPTQQASLSQSAWGCRHVSPETVVTAFHKLGRHFGCPNFVSLSQHQHIGCAMSLALAQREKATLGSSRAAGGSSPWQNSALSHVAHSLSPDGSPSSPPLPALPSALPRKPFRDCIHTHTLNPK